MESMNDKNFENALKNHRFKEKAPRSLLNQLQNEATWNVPWHSNPRVVVFAIAAVIISLAIGLSPKSQKNSSENPAPSEIKLVQPVEQVIADSSYGYNLEQKFLLNFGDSPETYLDARDELARQFESNNL